MQNNRFQRNLALILAAFLFNNFLMFGVAPIPSITTFTPTSGAVGTSITITGINFNTTPANNIVFFGATKATVTAATATSLSVTVPVGATYKPISVTDISTGLTAFSAKPFICTFAGSNGFDAASFATKVDYTTGEKPLSINICDFDGDGKPDIAVTNYTNSSVLVYQNTGTIGNPNFSNNINIPTGTFPYSIASGDIDGDGKPDLAVTNYTSNTLSILRNTSTGGTISFAAKVDASTGTSPTCVAMGDFNGDGKADLAVTNQDNNDISIFRNTSIAGTISLAPYISLHSGSNPNYVTICDIDGDLKPDLAVANTSSSLLSIFRNTRTTNTLDFASEANISTGINPFFINAGDLDGDGKFDLAVANYGANTISILRNTSSVGSVSFAPIVNLKTNTQPTMVSIFDIDGDGKLDLSVANYGADNISIFRNNCTTGSILFDSKVDYAGGKNAGGMAIGDIDGDNKPDILVENWGATNISLLRNTELPAPTITSISPATATSGDVVNITGTNFTGATLLKFGGKAAHSFNVVSSTSITAIVGPGSTGAITLNVPGGGNASIDGFTYTTPPTPTITSFSPTSAIAGATVTITGANLWGTTAVSFGDSTAKSFTIHSGTSVSAIVGYGTSGSVSLTTLGGTATLAGFTYLPPPSISSFTPTSGPIGTSVTITGTNFNTTATNNIVFFGAVKATVTEATATSLIVTVPAGTTYQPITITDITTGFTAYSKKPFVVTFEGNKTLDSSSFKTGTNCQTQSTIFSVSVCDLDGDGKTDIVAANYHDRSISVFRNTSTIDSISFATKIDFETGTYPKDIAIGDFDGDGKPDLAVVNYENVSIFRNKSTNGSISFDAKIDVKTGSYPKSISIGDLNGDGKSDLVVTCSNDISVLRNISKVGSLSFISSNYTTGVYSSDCVSIEDLDGDGKPDLALVYGNEVSILRNKSNLDSISFATKVNFITGSSPRYVSIGDLDNDGKPDLAVANSYSNNVSILLNKSIIGTPSFATKVDYPAGVTTDNISIADLNGDGKLDMVVSNSNSPFKTSLFLNKSMVGTISMVEKVNFNSIEVISTSSIGDFNGDGKPDIVMAIYNLEIYKNIVSPAPTITSFTPTSTTAGDTVTITGTNFNNTAQVKFGDSTAYSVMYVSPTSLKAVVQNGASGKVYVTVPGGGTDSIAGFTFITPPAPSISSFLPALAVMYDTVTIYGSNLLGASSVKFSGTVATKIISNSSTKILAIVGSGATGSISVTNPFGTGTINGFTYYMYKQTIRFDSIGPKVYPAYVSVYPSVLASSGLPVTLRSSDITVAKIISSRIDITGAGNCTIYANQAGNTTYAPAPEVSRTLSVTSATSISNTEMAGYNIYPNPAGDYLVVKIPKGSKVEVKVFDLTGSLKFSKKMENDQLDIRELTPGIYNLSIDNYSFKMIKQ